MAYFFASEFYSEVLYVQLMTIRKKALYSQFQSLYHTCKEITDFFFYQRKSFTVESCINP